MEGPNKKIENQALAELAGRPFAMYGVPVSVCGNAVTVRGTLLGDAYTIQPPIWHPAVDFLTQRLIANCPEDARAQLTGDDVSAATLESPSNLDAAVQYVNDREQFERRNLQMRAICSDHAKTCCEHVRFTCFKLHWVCGDDHVSHAPCPTCNWAPMPRK